MQRVRKESRIICIGNYTYIDVSLYTVSLQYNVIYSNTMLNGFHNLSSGSLVVTDIYRCDHYSVDYHVLKPQSKNLSRIHYYALMDARHIYYTVDIIPTFANNNELPKPKFLMSV